MSQRDALLTLYGTRRGRRVPDAEQASLLDELYRASPLSQKTARTAARDAAEPATALVSADAVVLDAEVLEALVALAHHSTDRADFVTDPDLLAMADRLVVDSSRADALLGVVFDLRDDRGLASLGPALSVDTDGRARPEHDAPTPHVAHEGPAAHEGAAHEDVGSGTNLLTAPPTVLSIARHAILEADIELVPPLLEQPGARCRARLVPVELGGEGEYAISFRTDVCFEMPAGLNVSDFVDDLFEPSQWPKRHSFWISMDEIPIDQWTDEGRALVARMERAQVVAEAAGARFGHRRIFNEAVGNRNNEGGTWPGTVLVFTDSHRSGANGRPNHHYLEYRLVPGISRYLLLDDGTIQVTEDGTNVCCTVTKMLFFSEKRYSTQAEVMADYACISGWAEQTRSFLMNWIDDKLPNSGHPNASGKPPGGTS